MAAFITGTPVKSSKAKIVVIVTDINDHSPVFGGNKFTTVFLTTSDFLNGESVYRAEASDADDGDNADVRYSLFKVTVDPEAFVIDERTGVVSPRGTPVSRFYYMVIAATDRGQPPRSTYMYLFVNVCRFPGGGWFCPL